jgi:hypothetical protein
MKVDTKGSIELSLCISTYTKILEFLREQLDVFFAGVEASSLKLEKPVSGSRQPKNIEGEYRTGLPVSACPLVRIGSAPPIPASAWLFTPPRPRGGGGPRGPQFPARVGVGGPPGGNICLQVRGWADPIRMTEEKASGSFCRKGRLVYEDYQLLKPQIHRVKKIPF